MPTCVCSQYDGGGGGGGPGGRGNGGFGYWPDERHHGMPGPSMMPTHQLAGPSTLEYRPPPRRAYPTGPLHPAVVPVMADDSALGVSYFISVMY